MKRALILGVLSLTLAGFPALAQEDSEDEPEPLPYVEVPVNLNGVDYKAEIDISGAEPIVVNGIDLDVSGHLPGAVRISRADGKSMADEGFRAREVIEAACATQGFRFESGVVPVLSPAGRWIFPGGCE